MVDSEKFAVVWPPDADREQEANYLAQRVVFASKLKRIIPILLDFAVGLVLVTFVGLTVRFLVEVYGLSMKPAKWSEFLDFLLESLAVFLFAFPLALVVTIALIYVQKTSYVVPFRRFLQYQIVVNVVAGLVTFVGIVILRRWLISIVQMLYINIMMGVLASIALCVKFERAEFYSLTAIRQPLLTTRLMANVLGQVIYQLIILFIYIYFGPNLWDVDTVYSTHHMTLIFNVFVLMCLFNQINARKIYAEHNVFQNIHKDWVFVGVWLLQWCLHVLLIQAACQWVDDISRDGLTCNQWLWAIAAGAGTLLWQQLVITVPCRHE